MPTSSTRLSRRSVLKASGGALVTASLAGCSGGDSSGDGGSGLPDTATIGLLVPESGPFGFLGADFRDGLQLRVDQINESDDTLPDTELEVLVGDTESAPQPGLSAAREFVSNDDVDVLIGAANSEVGNSVSQYAASEDVPFLLGMAGDISLTSGENCQYSTARLVPHNSVYTQIHPTWGVENIGTDAYVLYPDYATGYTQRDYVPAAIEAAGGTVAKLEAAPLGNDSWGTIIDDIQSVDPDWLFFGMTGGGQIPFLTQAVNRGFSDVPILGTLLLEPVTGQLSNDQLDQLPPLYRATRYTKSIDNEENNAFVGAFESEYDRPPVYASGYGYLNGGFYANAVAEAGSLETDPLMGAIEGLTWQDIVGTCSIRECDHQGHPGGAITQITSIDEENGLGEHEVMTTVSSERVLENLPACEDITCEFDQ